MIDDVVRHRNASMVLFWTHLRVHLCFPDRKNLPHWGAIFTQTRRGVKDKTGHKFVSLKEKLTSWTAWAFPVELMGCGRGHT